MGWGVGAGVLVASVVGAVVGGVATGAGVARVPVSAGEGGGTFVPGRVVARTSRAAVGLPDGGAAGGTLVVSGDVGALVSVSTAPHPASSAATIKAAAVARSRVRRNLWRWPLKDALSPRAV